MITRRDSDGVSDHAGAQAWDLEPSGALLMARLCLPDRLAVMLPAGALTIHPRLVEGRRGNACTAGDHMGEVLAIEIANRPGALFVESRTALGLVSAVLGVALPFLGGPLSRIERGVLEGAVASLVAKLGLAPWIRLGDGSPSSWPAGRLALELCLCLREETGWASVMTGDETMASLATLLRSRWAEPAAWLEVARTTVPACEMARAEVGDKVVFDETAALSFSEAWPARLFWRDRALDVQWQADGSIMTAGAAEQANSMSFPSASGRTGGVEAAISAGADCSLACQAPGSVRVSRAEPMVLKADGRTWAYGSPTAVDGAFAVAISRKVSR